MCIYIKGEAELTYNNQEHIFPAGLGGIKKLPKGMVSDQANKYFSSLEGKMMHSSLLSLPRMMLGPSKRKDKKEGKRIVQVLQVTEGENNQIELGYIREGVPYSIPQICINFEGRAKVVCSDEDGIDKIAELKSILLQENKKIYYRESNAILENEFIVGYADKCIYIGKNPNKQIEEEEIIRATLRIMDQIPREKYKHVENHVEMQTECFENEDIARIYGKVAFNVLAELAGEKYVENKAFDDVREWIMGKNNELAYDIVPRYEDNFIKSAVPEQSHYCFFMNVQGNIVAMVSFYGILTRFMNFGCAFDNYFNDIKGYICDWKSNKEYAVNGIVDFWSLMKEQVMSNKIEDM